jgi:hypothetical protein
MAKNNYFKSWVDIIYNNKDNTRNIWILTKSQVQKWNGDNSRNTGA